MKGTIRRPRKVQKASASDAAAPYGCPVDTLKIGPHRYRLVFDAAPQTEGVAALGLHDPTGHVITLSSELSRSHLAEIALHEINHALWTLAHLEDARGEENHCARHASTLTGVEADNLAFFRWRLDLLDLAVPL